jgi:hypothetical protein
LLTSLPGLVSNWDSSWALVAHTCASGGRDQEDYGSRSAQTNICQDPVSKIVNTKKGLVE